ncbi:MAG TPA: hypothetical protein VEH03_04550 [Burkholderiales bacterium]|nr:hypothetical protein [Burkholderiales bacterium]
MGVEIVRVPPDFKHPLGEDGGAIPGAHLEPLYYLDGNLKTAYQLYENVTEGTPESPVLSSLAELRTWLLAQGWDAQRIDFLLEHGHAPSFIART